MKRIAWILLALPACTQIDQAPPPPEGVEVLQRVNLNTIVDNPNFVGVSVDPNTGAVVLMDAWEGIFSLQGEHIADAMALMVDWDERPFTDVASLGDGKYALTVRSDGLLHDVNTGVTEVYFCYEPGFMEPEDYQITNGLAYDVTQQKLIAQPQTFNDDGLTDAEVAEYGMHGGQPAAWHPLRDAEFTAGGLAADDRGLLLGRDDTLHSYAYGDKEVGPLVNLSTLGIERIEGLALTVDGHLWIVDGADQELVELAGWR